MIHLQSQQGGTKLIIWDKNETEKKCMLTLEQEETVSFFYVQDKTKSIGVFFRRRKQENTLDIEKDCTSGFILVKILIQIRTGPRGDRTKLK